MKRLLICLLLYIPIAVAQEWEYRVVYMLPFDPMKPEKNLEKMPDGSFISTIKTGMINNYAKDGWEVVSVAGDTGAHVVYLRRKLPD